MMREIIDVPFPLAASSRLINFFTFHISIFFSASFCCGALMMAVKCQAPGKQEDRENAQLKRGYSKRIEEGHHKGKVLSQLVILGYV